MFTVSFVIQVLLLISVPLALGLWFNRRLGLSWFLFFGGALAFVSSWIVTNLLLLPGELGLMILSITQMGALYLIYRFQIKTARTEREALMAGLGLSGSNLILTGIFVALGFAQISSLRNASDETLIDLAARAQDISEEAVEPAKIDEMRASIDEFWNAPWYGPLIQPIQSFAQILPLRNATDETLVALIARTDEIPEEEIESDRINAAREFIDDFWNTPWYAPLIQPFQSLSSVPIQIALSVIVLGALTHNRWGPLMGAMALHFLSQVLPIYGRIFGNLIIWLVLSLLAGGVALWFLYRLWPVVRDQAEAAFRERSGAHKETNPAR